MTDQDTLTPAPGTEVLEEGNATEAAQDGESVTPTNENETGESQQAPDPAEPSADNPAAERVDNVQKRIDKITREKYDERRRAEALERELAYIRGQQDAQTVPQAGQRQDEALQRPKEEDFVDEADYVEAMANYSTQKAMAEYSAKSAYEAEAQQQAMAEAASIQAFSTRETAYAEKHPDYFDLVHSDDTAISRPMAEAIMVSAKGPEIAHYLGKNKAEARRIYDMPPYAAAIELGKIEAQLGVPVVRKTTNAPKPQTPIGSGGAIQKDEDRMTTAEYIAYRNAKVGRRGR